MDSEAHFRLPDEDAQALLDQREMYALPVGEQSAIVRDCDGRSLFVVPQDIGPQPLSTILLWGERCFNDGERLGRNTLKSQLLSMIGAQPAREAA